MSRKIKLDQTDFAPVVGQTITDAGLEFTDRVAITDVSDGNKTKSLTIEDLFAKGSTSTDIQAAINASITALVDASPATLDTLNELAAALGDDPNFATTVSDALALRLRVDTAAQGLTAPQKTNAKTNLDLQNVNNTSDADKPVSTATSTALGLKTDVTTFNAHTGDTGNPHAVTKAQVGLGNVDNTSDIDKPVSTATSTALGLKTDVTTFNAHTGSNANPHAVTKAQVGLGNADNTSDVDKPVSTATATALGLKTDTTTFNSHTGNTSNPHSVTKAQVGLGNVDNTSDSAKIIAGKTVTTLTSTAGVVTIDLSTVTEVYDFTLTENVTSWSITNLPAAGKCRDIYVNLTQHASAAKTCVSPATAGKTAGGAWTVSATLNSTEVLGFRIYSSGAVHLFPSGVLA